MISLGAMNCHHRFYDLEEFFASAHKFGYKSVEIWTGPQHFFIDYQQHEPIQKLIFLANKYGVRINGICPEQTNPKPNNMSARDSHMMERVYKYFCSEIDVAVAVGASQVVVTSGWAFLDEPLTDAYDRSVNMLRRISEYADSQHMHLAIEALQKSESLIANSATDLKQLIDDVNRPALKVCLDIGAMQAAADTISGYFATFGSDIVHVHYVDVDENMTTHLALGDGTRDITQDLIDLKQAGYDGVLSVESVDSRYYSQPQIADEQSMRAFKESLGEVL